MKRYRPIFHSAWLSLCVLLAACQTGDEPEPHFSGEGACHLRLDAELPSYGDAGTRATGHHWQQGDRVLLRFRVGETVATAVATYQSATQLWSINAPSALTDGSNGTCELAHIPGYAGSGNASLTHGQALYLTDTGTYRREAGIISVAAILHPVAARLRLRGRAGQNVSVGGLKHVAAYSLDTGQATWSEATLPLQVGADGYTPYTYVLPANGQRRINLDANVGVAAYGMTLAAMAMQPATSGFIVLPDDDDMHGWTIVNKDNGLSITQPQVSTVTGVARSTTAHLSAQVTDLGNGSILNVGFIVSTDATPTMQNGTTVTCGTGQTFSGDISGLQPTTTYYVRAYVRNELTTTLGAVSAFTTAEAGSLEFCTFGSDEDWNDGAASGNASTGSTIPGKDDFGEDEDWNTPTDSASTGSTIPGKDDFGEDEDWNL